MIKYKGEKVRIIDIAYEDVKVVISDKVKMVPKQYKIENLKRTWTDYVDPSDIEYK